MVTTIEKFGLVLEIDFCVRNHQKIGLVTIPGLGRKGPLSPSPHKYLDMFQPRKIFKLNIQWKLGGGQLPTACNWAEVKPHQLIWPSSKNPFLHHTCLGLDTDMDSVLLRYL